MDGWTGTKTDGQTDEQMMKDGLMDGGLMNRMMDEWNIRLYVCVQQII